ncbi:WecB/TagA/CpsF family glycosyltransferase [Caenimonas sp. DR4.4]|uniref:WecB/TagA/CpsF family glycosyltransferase n=2 Tax=Caenimonas aquaedulcis TaxID=2793270 RepID=A0A931MIQ2_9BURK|nr:WecB/TagA/CpsF family glycosyltransferase [Caenimonas aquaedulcis]
MGEALSPEWRTRWHHLVKALTRVQSERGEKQLLDSLAHPLEPVVVGFVNAHAMNSAAVSQTFYNALSSADILLRDGIGLKILLRLLNQPPGLNLNGTDLIPKILARYPGRKIALFGTQDPYLSTAREVIETRIAPASHCVTAHGFLEPTEYLKLAAQHKPALIVLGMGMPKQEDVAVMLRAALGYPCVIVCGGAILDFLGNKTTRAPAWMRKTGMEWAYRLALEPKRLFRRYVMGNPLFLSRAVRLATRTPRPGESAKA